MALLNGAAGNLFKATFLINGPSKGFTDSYHLLGADYTVAVPKAIALAGFLRAILPGDCEIFYARVSRDDSARDGQYVPDAIGGGQYITALGPPAVKGVVNTDYDHALMRFENTEGGWISPKIGPLPDDVVNGGLLGAFKPANVIGTPGAAPAAVADFTAFATNFNKLMQAIAFYTIYVRSGHVSGGPFQYAPWLNAYCLRTAEKKGGRPHI